MSTGKRTKTGFFGVADAAPQARRAAHITWDVFFSNEQQDQNLYMYSRPISIQGFSGLLVFWSAPLPTGDQQSRSPAVHVQNLGLLFSTMIASRGDLLRLGTAVLAPFFDIHRMFPDFQSQHRRTKSKPLWSQVL
jgi:hypothetical protein